MDAVDDAIVKILSTDGRASFSEVGRRVGLSTNAAAARVRRLEATGVIVGYRAVLAEEAPAPGTGIETFIDVRLRPDHDSEQFLAWTRAERTIREAVHVTGPYDYLLHVVVADTGELDRLLRRMKATAGVGQTQTRLALRTPRT
jgi:Lrp/AsnC family leucine-responsive transcriptional regulator